MLLSMVILSRVVNAPLEGHANADKTPNPSKAPWYFLNLQELLLHMHPSLAGVIVPSACAGRDRAQSPTSIAIPAMLANGSAPPKAVPIASS